MNLHTRVWLTGRNSARRSPRTARAPRLRLAFALFSLLLLYLIYVPQVAWAGSSNVTLHFDEWGTNHYGESYDFSGYWNNPDVPKGCSNTGPVPVKIVGTWNEDTHMASTLTIVSGSCYALRFRINTFFQCQENNPWFYADSHCSLEHSSHSGAGGYNANGFPSRRAIPTPFPKAGLSVGFEYKVDARVEPPMILDDSRDREIWAEAILPVALSDEITVGKLMHFQLIYYNKGGAPQHLFYTEAFSLDSGHSAGASLVLSAHTLRDGVGRVWSVIAWYPWGRKKIRRTFTFTVKRTKSEALSFETESLIGPPIVQTPKQNQIFVNQGVNIEVNRSPVMKHTNYSRWEYVFEWKRADYHTAANEAYWKIKHHWNNHIIPPVIGLASPMQPWLSPARLRAMPEEDPGNTSGFQILGSKRLTISTHLNFSSLRSKRMDSSYLYQFRVREHIRNSKAYGPWSAWRSFIVQEPFTFHLPSLVAPTHRLNRPVSTQSKQQSGQQHFQHVIRRFSPVAPVAPVRRLNRPVRRLPRSQQTAILRHATQQPGVQKKLTPMAPVRRLSLPVRRLPKSQQAASPRHAAQQRGVRKKLTPAAPALRLAPVAPVRRLSLPARPGLNR